MLSFFTLRVDSGTNCSDDLDAFVYVQKYCEKLYKIRSEVSDVISGIVLSR